MSTSAPKSHPIRRVARVVIEFITPFHVGTGEGGYGADALVATDVNGLPTIPGSSLAGALRTMLLAHTGSRGKANAESIFGFQTGDKGCGSRLSLTWAAIHDHNDQPVEGLRPRSCLDGDPVLRQALGLRIRDHVRLNHRGAAEHRKKFYEQPAAAGHHFTFEMELVDEADATGWQNLLACLPSPVLRLGGKSRRGYGAFKVVRIGEHSFNLAQLDEFTAYASHPASLCQPASALINIPLPAPAASPGAVTIEIHVQPRGYWMFGGGEDLPPNGADPADMAPLREDRIVWHGSAGSVEDNVLLLPGSAIKGAISHRVAFHANRLNKTFADQIAVGCTNDDTGHTAAQEALHQVTGNHNETVRSLFGFMNESKTSSPADQAARGCVLIDDVFWPSSPPPQQRIPHASIDRFTGGAADGKLFDERPLWKGAIPPLIVTILDADKLPILTRQALKATLDDLANGHLALGAGAGRGLGYFEPNPGQSKPVVCSAGDDWFDKAHTATTP